MNAWTAIAGLLATLLLGHAAQAAKATDYDTNCDGNITSDEFEQFARDQVSAPLTSFDINRDNLLDHNELSKANDALRKACKDASKLIVEFVSDFPDGQPVARFAIQNKTPDAPEFKAPSRLDSIPVKLREKHEDISHDVQAKPAKNAKPAQLAFTRDIHADNGVLLINGALMWPTHVNKDIGLLAVPSVSINKVSNDNDTAKDTDSVVFRLGLDWEREGLNDSSTYWRLNPTWTTDTSFDVDVRGVEAQWESVRLFRGSSRQYYLPRTPLGFRWRGILHAEYGRVHDTGGNQNLLLNQEFVRAGVKIDSQFVLRSTDRVTAGLAWEYLASIGGDLRDRKLFKASLSYNIDESGHFKLMSSYSAGDTSAALEDQKLWTVGLGLRF